MKTIVIILFVALINLTAQAQISTVASGANIEAAKINLMISEINKMYDIGDIRSSLLTESQFQSRNGNCWVRMAGQSVAGSLYESVTGRSALPSADGRFLRNAGGAAAPLATTQEDEFASHTHIQNAHSHGLTMYQDSGGGGAPNNPVHGSATINSIVKPTSAVAATNQNTGGSETRPKNLTVNMFVKIDNCN